MADARVEAASAESATPAAASADFAVGIAVAPVDHVNSCGEIWRHAPGPKQLRQLARAPHHQRARRVRKCGNGRRGSCISFPSAAAIPNEGCRFRAIGPIQDSTRHAAVTVFRSRTRLVKQDGASCISFPGTWLLMLFSLLRLSCVCRLCELRGLRL